MSDSKTGKKYRLTSLEAKKPGLFELLMSRSLVVGVADYMFHIGLYGSIVTAAIAEISNFLPGVSSIFGGHGWLISFLHGVAGLLLMAGGVGFVARYFANRHFRLAYGKIFYLDLAFMLTIATTGTLQALAVFGLVQVNSFTAYPFRMAASIHVIAIYTWIVASLFLGGAVRHALATILWRLTSPKHANRLLLAFSEACGRCGRCIEVCPLCGPAPCSPSCAGRIDIPSYLSRIRNGELPQAAKILLDRNPIPAITGRVCPHLCESTCIRNEFDEPVSIRSIERFIGDYVLDNFTDFSKPPPNEAERSVAIVGSGPAGLSAAYYLRKMKHQVTVFDKMTEPGGMLTYGIPAYRLPKDVIRNHVNLLQDMGVKFKLGADVGSNVTFKDLQKEYDSVFLATGAWRQRALDIEKEALLMSGLDFLANVNRGIKESPGKRVLVIGGGNVAVDVAVTALRLGSEQVTMACLECREEMPAFSEDIERAIEEGVVVMPSWGPHKILETGGSISGMELARCTSLFNSKGEFSPTLDLNVRETVETDLIILAIGQAPDLSYADESLRTERGLITVDKDTQATNIPGVFAGGDATAGTASVIEAVAAGRRAANSINLHLGGESPVEVRPEMPLLRLNPDSLVGAQRVKVAQRSRSERSVDEEDVRGLGTDAVGIETRRCFNCGILGDGAYVEAPVSKLRRYYKTIADGQVSVADVKSIADRLAVCRLCGLCVGVCPFSFNFVDVYKRVLFYANEADYGNQTAQAAGEAADASS